jgi:hypothetical protein
MALKKSLFLEALRAGKTIRHACEDASVQRSTIQIWRKSDPEFAAEFTDAFEDGVDLLEAELVYRATRSDKPSDLLLLAALRAKRPALYREQYKAPEAEKTDGSGDKFAEKFDAFTKALIEAQSAHHARLQAQAADSYPQLPEPIDITPNRQTA